MSKKTDHGHTKAAPEGADESRESQYRQAREAPRQGGAAGCVSDKNSAPEKTPGQGAGFGGRN